MTKKSRINFRCSVCPEEHKALPGADYWLVNSAIGALGWRILPRDLVENPNSDYCLKCPKCAEAHAAVRTEA